MKRALLIAFHFPPIRHSSGIQRALANVRYLPAHDWQPIVLTVRPGVYADVGEDQVGDVPADTVVHRAWGLDAKRQLAIAGRYPGFAANPDRYASWILGAFPAGMRLIRKYRPDVIWSTYPIASALIIGQRLARHSGLPWVADLRDSLHDAQYPVDPATRRRHEAIEAETLARAARVVVTSPGTEALLRERYPAAAERLRVIPNGYDEEIFESMPTRDGSAARRDGPLLLLHAGILYPVERDPRPFFEALAQLKRQGAVDAGRLRVRLRATGHDERYRPLLEALDITDLVELAPAVDYRHALAEMQVADGLLIFQSAGCNHQTPAKLYEYFRAQRPVLALTDGAGDTATAMRDAGMETILPLDDMASIAAGLCGFLDALEQGRAAVASAQAVTRYSRRDGVARLAALFDEVTESPL